MSAQAVASGEVAWTKLRGERPCAHETRITLEDDTTRVTVRAATKAAQALGSKQGRRAEQAMAATANADEAMLQDAGTGRVTIGPVTIGPVTIDRAARALIATCAEGVAPTVTNA